MTAIFRPGTLPPTWGKGGEREKKKRKKRKKEEKGCGPRRGFYFRRSRRRGGRKRKKGGRESVRSLPYTIMLNADNRGKGGEREGEKEKKKGGEGRCRGHSFILSPLSLFLRGYRSVKETRKGGRKGGGRGGKKEKEKKRGPLFLGFLSSISPYCG